MNKLETQSIIRKLVHYNGSVTITTYSSIDSATCLV